MTANNSTKMQHKMESEEYTWAIMAESEFEKLKETLKEKIQNTRKLIDLDNIQKRRQEKDS